MGDLGGNQSMKLRRKIGSVNGSSKIKYQYNGVVWNLYKNRDYNKKELDAIFEQVNKVLVSCKRATIIRFDLTPFGYDDDNKDIEVFSRRLFKKIKRIYKLKSNGIGYCWCREVSDSGRLHYHWMLVLDGKKVQSSYGVSKIISEIYRDKIGSASRVISATHGLERSDYRAQKVAMKHVAYLAKIDTRDKPAGRVKAFSRGKVKLPDDALNNYKVGLHNSMRELASKKEIKD